MKNNLDIPEEWTFKSANVVDNFDSHVREQLPWYELATRAVTLLGRHYCANGGLVYDIGASTGNITLALDESMPDRALRFVAIDDSIEMCAKLKARTAINPNNIEVVCANAMEYDYKQYDFAVAFLSLMFFPVWKRREWLNKITSLMKPGGAFVVVDKIVTPSGYVGTALRRMAMQWKLDAGALPADIIAKELSLAGYQRPLCPHLFDTNGRVFFAFGEFIGWVLERSE
jgi:tRNA (cmo5U34)-methyltransferase